MIPSRWQSVARMATLALLWGSVFLWIKLALTNGLSPVQIGAIRCALGAGVLLALSRAYKQALPTALSTWKRLFAAAFVCNFLPFLLLAIGAKSVDSGIVGVLHATTPLWSFVIGVGIGSESTRQWVRMCGLLVGFTGVALIFAPWQATGLSGWGAGAVLAASLSYAVGFAYMARNLAGSNTGPIAMSAAQLLAATAWSSLSLPFGAHASGEIQLTGIIAVALLGVFGTGATFYLNYRIIEDEGPTNAAAVGYLLPVVSLALGASFLNEQLSARIAVGAAVVLVGVGIIRFERSWRTAEQLSSNTR